MTDAENELIKKAQEGDISSFEQLIRKYDAKVLSLTYSMVGNREDAQDLYQEIFLRVYKSLSGFRFNSTFYTWMYRIVVNQCINFRKKRQREQLLSASKDDSGIDIFDRMESKTLTPEEALINSELSELINKAVDKLPEKQRMVFILRHYEGKKIAEIAEIMKCTDGTVKNYLFRTSEKLKKCLKEYRKK